MLDCAYDRGDFALEMVAREDCDSPSRLDQVQYFPMETKANPHIAVARKQILLRSERLEIQVAEPGSIYWGSRFDWTGFVTQVTLDGKHTFCVPESLEPGHGDGGVGLCGEFGVSNPIGYSTARPGDEFPKLGVGLLTRPDDRDYRFSRRYAVRPFPMRTHVTENCARFEAEPQQCRGYALRMEKKLSVEGNALTIRCRLYNEGELPVRTDEYNHNFVAMNRCPVGPDYVLELPFDLKRSRLSNQGELDALTIKRDQVWWPSAPPRPFYLSTRDLLPDAPARWKLTHAPTGLSLTVCTDFAWDQFALYGSAHCICPEVFIAVNIEPGEYHTWTRRYEFNQR